MQTANETYAGVEKLIHKIISNHQSKFGGYYNDLLSTANWWYWYAARTHDPAKGTLPKRVAFLVNQGLSSDAKKRSKQKQFPETDIFRERNEEKAEFNCHQENGLKAIPDRHHFDLEGLLGEISEDAACMIRTALELEGGLPRISQKRNAVIQFLQGAGWSLARILESFREIRDALQS